MTKILPKDLIEFFKMNDIWIYINVLEKMFIKNDIRYYFVGGVVRDGIMFLLTPTQKYRIQDVDIVVYNKDLNFLVDRIKHLKQFKSAKIKKHLEFLTTTITLQNYRIDLSFPRKEIYNFSGALPVVSKGSIDDDLFRRDFTINSISLFYDKKIDDYKFYDPFCGIDDIKNKLVRILHKKSFFDDPTRIIRAIRFSASLGYKLEKNTEKILTYAIKKNVLKNISKDRLVNEFVYILKKCDDLFTAIKMLEKYNIIKSYNFITDFLELLKKDAKKLNLKNIEISREERYFIRLLYLVENLYKKSNFYNEKSFIKQRLTDLNLTKEEKLQITNAIDFLYYGKKCEYNWLKTYIKIFNKKNFIPLISAKDLINLGLAPGPLIGEILFKVKQQQNNGKLKTKFDAINFIKQLLRLK